MAVPLFVLYPAKPEVFKKLIETLGEPSWVEVLISVEKEEMRRIAGLDIGKVGRVTVECNLKVSIDEALALYNEYYECYISRGEAKGPGGRIIQRFKAMWTGEGYSAEFDGFELRMHTTRNVEKAVSLLHVFNEKIVEMKVELSERAR